MTKYVKSSGRHSGSIVYHTDLECKTLKNAKGYRETTEREIELKELDLCSYCAGEDVQSNVEKDFSYQVALRKAAEKNAD